VQIFSVLRVCRNWFRTLWVCLGLVPKDPYWLKVVRGRSSGTVDFLGLRKIILFLYSSNLALFNVLGN